jgi:HSP20 family protein
VNSKLIVAGQYYDFFDFPFFGFWGPLFEGKQPPAPSRGGINLYETKDSLVAEVAVPGARKEEITVEVKNGVLRIDAEHRETKEETKARETVYRSQMQSSFHYTANLPKEVGEDKARAKLKDGILTVTLPLAKKEKKTAKGVTIEES